MTPLSPHFSLEEMCRSETAAKRGIDNFPSLEVVDSLRNLCVNILEPLRAKIGFPIVVNSGYRSPELNKLVGGARNSQHMLGEAVDIEVPQIPNKRLAQTIRGLGLPYDQLILEHAEDSDPNAGWVHVSHRAKDNRTEFFMIPRVRALKE